MASSPVLLLWVSGSGVRQTTAYLRDSVETFYDAHPGPHVSGDGSVQDYGMKELQEVIEGAVTEAMNQAVKEFASDEFHGAVERRR